MRSLALRFTHTATHPWSSTTGSVPKWLQWQALSQITGRSQDLSRVWLGLKNLEVFLLFFRLLAGAWKNVEQVGFKLAPKWDGENIGVSWPIISQCWPQQSYTLKHFDCILSLWILAYFSMFYLINILYIYCYNGKLDSS